MQNYRTSILPIFAVMITLTGISYTACHDSHAAPVVKKVSTAAVLRNEISKFEQTLNELKTIHQDHVGAYSAQMGCTVNSTTMELIKKHEQLLGQYALRLEYHKLQLIQGDTTDEQRNTAQLDELKKDYDQLLSDGNIIRNGFDDAPPPNVTK